MESSLKQLTEILSKISSSVGFSKVINNFVIQKEREKLTLFPLVDVNDNEKNDLENGSGNHENESGDNENQEELEQLLEDGAWMETENGADTRMGVSITSG